MAASLEHEEARGSRGERRWRQRRCRRQSQGDAARRPGADASRQVSPTTRHADAGTSATTLPRAVVRHVCVSPRPQKERAQKQTPSGSISLDEARRILAAKVRARRDALDGGLRAHSEWVLCRRRLRACRRRPRSRRASSGRRRSSAASNRTLPPSWRTRPTALRSESSEWANTRASASRARPRPRCWRPHRLQPLLLV